MDAYGDSENVDYDALVRESGVSLIDQKLAKKIGHPSVPEYFFAHRDLNKIIDRKFALVTGRGPSRNMHLGHFILFRFMKFLQDKFGAKVFIPFSDDEKLLARGLSKEHVIRMGYENLLDIIAIGFDPKKTEVMMDLVNMKQEVYNLAIQLSSHMTANTVRSAMGFSADSSIGFQFYPAMQAAHILYPTLKYKLPVIVPIGFDQDVFIKLTRDASEKVGLEKPGDILSKFLPGLSGGKMSSSIDETAVYTTDPAAQVRKKIMSAFTGGRDTAEEHRRLGGQTDKCTICKYQHILFGNDEMVQKCKAGKILCGENKKDLVERINGMLAEHQEKREKAKSLVEKFVPGLEEVLG
jgi:tryptophanyl-tRNA synthetase